MTALLIYRNSTPEALAWFADYDRRYREIRAEVIDWLDRFCDENGGPPREKRATWSYGDGRVYGISWPESAAIPRGWRRNPSRRETIRPHMGTRIGKDADKFLLGLRGPSIDNELQERFGMPRRVMVAEHSRMYSYGFRATDDALWVTWGTRDVVDKLGDVESHGWVRVPLTEYIERFGEDAL